LKTALSDVIKDPNQPVKKDLLQYFITHLEKPLIWTENEETFRAWIKELTALADKNKSVATWLHLMEHITPANHLRIESGQLIAKPNDLEIMHRLIYQVDLVLQLMKKTIQPILDYTKTYEKKSKENIGSKELRANIAKKDLTNPNNFFKYRYALALQASLAMLEGNLKNNVNSEKIGTQFTQIMGTLSDIRDYIMNDDDKKSEVGKNFHRLIEAAIEKMPDIQKQWSSCMPDIATHKLTVDTILALSNHSS